MTAEQTATLSSIPFDFWSAVIAAVFGLVSGAVASLVSPWVHWFIELRRKSIEHKLQTIAALRKLVDESATFTQIETSSLWGLIEAELSEDEKLCVLFQSSYGPIRITVGANPLTEDEGKKKIISKAIARIESKWGLTKSL